MNNQYSPTQSIDLPVTETKPVSLDGLEMKIHVLQQQVSRMTAELEFLNKERNRMKADIQMLANAIRK
jgi:prefoldin subunit 5